MCGTENHRESTHCEKCEKVLFKKNIFIYRTLTEGTSFHTFHLFTVHDMAMQ